MPLLQTPRDRAGLLIALLAAFVAIALSPFLSRLLGAAVLHLIFVNPYRRLEGMVKPGVAAVAIFAGALVLIALPSAGSSGWRSIRHPMRFAASKVATCSREPARCVSAICKLARSSPRQAVRWWPIE